MQMQRYSIHQGTGQHTLSTRPAVSHSTHFVCRAKHKCSTACHSVLPDSPQLSVGIETLAHLKSSFCSAAAAVTTSLNLSTGAACAATTGSITGVQLDIAADMNSGELLWPVALSLLAGLSTSIGGIIAVTLSPDEGTLAFLLGTAIGVMATVSGVELWWHSAAQLHDFLGVTAAVLGGAALFAVLDPLLPKTPETEELLESQQPLNADSAQGMSDSSSIRQHTAHPSSQGQHDAQGTHHSTSAAQGTGSHRANTALRPVAVRAGQVSSIGDASTGSTGILLQPQATGQRRAGTQQQQQDLQHLQGTGEQRHIAASGSTGSHTSAASASAQDSRALLDQGSDAVMDIHSMNDSHKGLGSNSNSSSQLLAAASETAPSAAAAQRHKSLLRLSLLMGITMTLHNLPEGFAVAFSAFTDIAPIMVLAIGLHNIPEGLICAAPFYAATGSKWKAIGIATASGLSEPLGALLALLVFKPFVKSLAALDYVLAATGGIMLAVCVLELWPEGRRCGRDERLLAGILLGTVVMAWTLYVGV